MSERFLFAAPEQNVCVCVCVGFGWWAEEMASVLGRSNATETRNIRYWISCCCSFLLAGKEKLC